MKNCLIFGSGRSGTSMLAGTLYKAGYYMGDDLYPPRESNPKGFFENKFINDLNEEIIIETREKNKNIRFPFPPLRKGQMWLEIIPLNAKLYSAPHISKKIKFAVSKQPFCYKDPRLSYTYPIWRKYLDEHINLVIFRHPGVTAKSIIKECERMEYLSDVKMSFERALEIWKHMYLYILENYDEEKNWLFFHYEQLFEEEKLKLLKKILDADIDEGFPDISLRRTRFSEKIPEKIEKIYLELCKISGFTKNKKVLAKTQKGKKSIDKKYYIEMDIRLLLMKKTLKDTEMFRVGLNYMEMGNFREAYKWLNKVIKNSSDKELIFKSTIKLLEINKINNLEVESGIVKKYLKSMVFKKKKKDIDLYHIASLYKKLEDYKRSKKWFNKLIRNTKDNSLKGGAYFHLGEIELWEGNRKKAIQFFKECLIFMPEHKKAKFYIENYTE